MKITDKMRLDWLSSKREFHLHSLYGGVWIGGGQFGPDREYETPRQAIDAAIRTESRAKKGKP